MASHSALTLHRQLAAAQDWWREAGVDCIFADEPHSWLESSDDAAPAIEASARVRTRARPSTKVEAPPAIGGPAASWPIDLAAFHAWWLAEPSLEFGGTGPRIVPRGASEPALMVLVPMPEAADCEALLSGREGELVANMLAAMQIAPDAVYLAAALPRHMAQADWKGLVAAGLGAIVRHHLALVRPKRLLMLGHGILPLLGHDRAQAPALVKQTAIQAAGQQISVPTLVGFAPDRLLENARARAMLWRQWLDWSESQGMGPEGIGPGEVGSE